MRVRVVALSRCILPHPAMPALPPSVLPPSALLHSALNPPAQLSPSPAADWLVLFRGGTLAIYPHAALRPAPAGPPLATFPFPPPLAIAHLYPPRTHLPHARAAPAGPRPPLAAPPGPTFTVLTASTLFLFHPQQLADSPGWRMHVVHCPLHTRWHATSAGPPPPHDGTHIDSGWLDLVPGVRGVWVGWERGNTSGVLRAEIGVDKAGNHCACLACCTACHADPARSYPDGPIDLACTDSSSL